MTGRPLRAVLRVVLPWAVAAVALAGCTREQPATSAHYVVGAPYEAGGQWHYPRVFGSYDRTGLASVISSGHAATTTDGETFREGGLMAQSPVLPLPSLVRITNLQNGRSLTVRVNDRGPEMPGRLVAVTRHVAGLLGFPDGGVAEVRVELLADRSSALQSSLGAGLHMTAAPVASVLATALPPPPGTAGSAGPSSVTFQATKATPATGTFAGPLSGVVHQGTPEPGPLYVQIGGFGSGNDAREQLYRLGGMPGTVVPQPGLSETLYAVRLGPYDSVEAADAALAQVLRRGVPSPEIVVR
ncbi:MAG TPA: RlpA-like double-psi beta-barrel domain-containing protein [Acidiphilium sp.]